MKKILLAVSGDSKGNVTGFSSYDFDGGKIDAEQYT
jgi:hypothetical protein